MVESNWYINDGEKAHISFPDDEITFLRSDT